MVAHVLYYVGPAGSLAGTSAEGLGVGTGGNDPHYTKLYDWGTATENVPADTFVWAVVTGQTADTWRIIIEASGFPRSATQRRGITVLAEKRNKYLSDTPHVLMDDNDNEALQIGRKASDPEDYFVVEWLHIVNTSFRAVRCGPGADHCTVTNCIIDGVDGIERQLSLDRQTLTNSIVRASGYAGDYSGNFLDSHSYGCTFVGGTYNIRNGSLGTTILQGNVMYGATTAILYRDMLDATSSHNAADEDGTTNYSASNWVWNLTDAAFADAAGGNYSPAAGSGLIDAGTDLESVLASFDDAQYSLPRKDVAGNPRPAGAAWDIGAYQYVDQGGGDPPPPSNGRKAARLLPFAL